MLINLRNALMASRRSPLPPGARWVEYLESTGTQYIDTGVNPQSSTTWSTDIVCLPKSGVTYMSLIGYSYTTLGIQSVGITNSKWAQTSLSVDYANPTLVHADQNGQSFNGVQGNNYNIGKGLLYLFHRANSSSQYPWIGKICSAKIWVESVLLRDFRPIAIGDKGYMLDMVSGQYLPYGNAGTGDFVLGPDVVPVEWLGSDGNQYIDTGVKPDATYTFDSTVAVMQSNYNCTYWGCRSSGTYQTNNSQCYLASNTTAATESYRRIRLLSTSADSDANWNSGIEPQTGVFYQLSGMSTVSTMNTMTYPMILFGLNNIGQMATNVGKVRIAKWTAYKSGAKANNFLPVRVGTDSTSWEGAMMDVLTRRIYRNAGTGAFGYGVDLPLETLAN